jgi:hypothetical protein
VSETKTEAIAVTRSESRIDKSGWGPGPWDDEPDLVEWQSASVPSFWCQVARGPMGALCGYVAVPPGHPAHGKDWNAIDVEVHGGLSFSGPGVANLWAIGFDCGHAYDVQPELDAVTRQVTGRCFSEGMNEIDDGMPRVTYKSLPFVRAEVESLARQLAAMGAALTEGGES